jgi:hypothetical protein
MRRLVERSDLQPLAWLGEPRCAKQHASRLGEEESRVLGERSRVSAATGPRDSWTGC